MRRSLHLAVICLAIAACRNDDPGQDEAGTESGADDEQEGDGDGDGECFEPGDPWPDPLLHRGRAEGDTFIEILDVVADGDLVYSCTGTQGLTIWEVSDPMQAMLLVENVGPSGLANVSYPRCQHFAKHAEQELAVISSRSDEIQPVPWLFLYDISDPEAPVPVKGWSGTEHIEGTVFVGDRIFAAAHTSGIMIFEDQGGEDLVHVGGFSDPDSDGWMPAVAGDTLVVAEGGTGLRTYDISGGEPVLLATVALEGSANDVVISGDIAYVSASSIIATVDISDPASPTILDQHNTLGTALGVAFGEDDVLLTAEWDEVRGYDVSDPADIRQVISETVPVQAASSFTRVLAVDAQPETGLVFAGEWEGMHVFEQNGNEPAPEVWATPQNVNFGTVEPGEFDDAVVLVRNLGSAPLRISDIIAANPEFEVETNCVEIAPGDTAAIEVRFSPLTTGQSADSLVLITDDPDEKTFALDLIGNVPGLDVGDPAPEFELWDLDGQKWTNDDIAGKVTILAYFATF